MFQIMRYRAFDEARAKALGDAIDADASNVDPAIVNRQEGMMRYMRPLTVAGVRCIDQIDPYYDMYNAPPVRHEMAPLLAEALRTGTVSRSKALPGFVGAIVDRLSRDATVASLPVGTQIDVMCATPWSAQRVCYWPLREDDDDVMEWKSIPLEIDGLPQAAEAGLFQRTLHMGPGCWKGRVVGRNADGLVLLETMTDTGF